MKAALRYSQLAIFDLLSAEFDPLGYPCAIEVVYRNTGQFILYQTIYITV